MHTEPLTSPTPIVRPSSPTSRPDFGKMLSKVPEVTVFFWVIKVLCTTVGETAADFLSDTLGLGLTLTSVVMTIGLIAILWYQFRQTRYIPWIYWLAVAFISIVGTLITDNLSDNFGVSLELTTAVFGVALIATFLIWYRSEGTLSIHSITTRKREAYYWLAILFTFALGTAAGDLVSERYDLGYWKAALIFGALIVIVAVAYYGLHLNEVTAFWLAYILTRPLGASIGDLLTADKADGGLGFTTTAVTIVFLTLIVGTVFYLTISGRDAPAAVADPSAGLSEAAAD